MVPAQVFYAGTTWASGTDPGPSAAHTLPAGVTVRKLLGLNEHWVLPTCEMVKALPTVQRYRKSRSHVTDSIPHRQGTLNTPVPQLCPSPLSCCQDSHSPPNICPPCSPPSLLIICLGLTWVPGSRRGSGRWPGRQHWQERDEEVVSRPVHRPQPHPGPTWQHLAGQQTGGSRKLGVHRTIWKSEGRLPRTGLPQPRPWRSSEMQGLGRKEAEGDCGREAKRTWGPSGSLPVATSPPPLLSGALWCCQSSLGHSHTPTLPSTAGSLKGPSQNRY